MRAPIWLSRLTRPVDQVRARRAIADLQPLWTLLASAVPDIELVTGARADARYRVYRMVIEIRDAQMALRPHVPAHIVDWARNAARRHGIPAGRDTALIVEAVELVAALRVYLTTTPPCRAGSLPAASGAGLYPNTPFSGTGKDGQDENRAVSMPPITPARETADRTRYGRLDTLDAETVWLAALARTLISSPVITELRRIGVQGSTAAG